MKSIGSTYDKLYSGKGPKICKHRRGQLELRHLRYFIKAAELQNFTRAAEALYVSQPTLSVQIQQLEEELGAELFSRSGRSIKLTETGQVFLKRAKEAIRSLEIGTQEVDALNSILRGHLHLGSMPLYGSRYVSGWICRFNSQYPGVEINYKSLASEDLEEEVLAGRMDLGFTIVPPQHGELQYHELFKDEIVCVVSEGHEAADKKKLTVKDLEALPLVLPSERISATRLLGNYCEEHGIELGASMRFDDGHALLSVLKGSRFATFLPRGAVQNNDALVVMSMPPPGIPVSVGLVWTNLSPSTKAFLDLVKTLTKDGLKA